MTFSKQFRPRFSLRTLAIVVALVCAYFAAFAANKWMNVRTGSLTDGEADKVGLRA